MNDATGRNTARRRRADTIARCGRIMETARRLPLTRDVLAEAIERATPVQPDLMESRLDAEIASRERSKRVRLLRPRDSRTRRTSRDTTGPTCACPPTGDARSSRRSTS